MTATYDETRAIGQEALEDFLADLIDFAGEKGELQSSRSIISYAQGYIEPYAFLKEEN